MQRHRTLLVLAAAVLAASQAGTATAQQSPSRKPAPTQQVRQYFDMYEPVQRLRLRRETCGRNELAAGAFCVKACKTNYSLVPGSNPPRCRSLTPLPEGQFPGPVRKEMDVQTWVPPPASSKTENPKNGW